MNEIAVDPEQIGRFVDALFRNASEGGYVSIRAFYDDKLARERNERPVDVRYLRLNGDGLTPVVNLATRIAERAAAASRPVVVCPPVATFSSAKSATEKTLLEGLTLSVELDERAEDAVAKLRAILGPPTLVVASGGEWADPATGEVSPKLHAHWRLAEPSQSAEEHERLKRARALACDFVGADATCKAIVHPMRWAGTVHRKNPDRPRLARIVEENAEAEIVLDDALGELEGLEALRESLGGEKPEPSPTYTTGDTDLLMACAERIDNADLAWSDWNRIAMAFWGASGGSEQGYAAFAAFSSKSRKHSDAAARARWSHFTTSPPDRIGVGTLIYEARRSDPSFLRRSPRDEKNSAEKRLTKPADIRVAVTGDYPFDTSHDGLALDMGRQWQDARFVAVWGHWLFWDGAKWTKDELLEHSTRTRAYLRGRADKLVRWAQEAQNEKLIEACEAIAKQLRSKRMMDDIVSLARSNPEQAASVGQWDRDPWLPGTPAGTVDLRTGKLRAASTHDFITKTTAVSPAAPGTSAPIWTAFLARIFAHDPELVSFVKRAIGCSLIGNTDEHVLFFAWGEGGNGKGVLLNTLSRLLGEYAAVAPQDLLLVTQSDRHPCDMAMLRGARLVTAQELGPGRAWDEPKLKSLTGGDPITARFMRQDFFTYQPAFKLFVAGNNKPRFKSVDQAIRRRVLLLPFLQNIPASERDPALPDKLKAEWPSILRWAIEGCLEYQRTGLQPPPSVLAATEDYLNAEDDLGTWLEDCCSVSPSIDWTPLSALYASYKQWAEARGQHPGTVKSLSKALDERAFKGEKRAVGKGFRGIGLVQAACSNDANDGTDPSSCSDPAGAQAFNHTQSQCGYNGAVRHFRHNEADDEVVL